MLTSNMNGTKAIVDMVCTDTQWGSLNVTGVDQMELRNYFCSLDMDKLVMDLYSLMDIMGFVSEVNNCKIHVITLSK